MGRRPSPEGLPSGVRPSAHHAQTMCTRCALGPPLQGAKDLRIGFEDVCRISPQRPKTSVFGGYLILDNTPSVASIIPDDADDAMRAGAENCRQRRGNAGKETLEVNEMEVTGIAPK